MSKTFDIVLTVNGEAVTRSVPARLNLVDFLRHDLGLTGSHVGCEHGVCGACTLMVNGDNVRGCLMLAVQANGADITTVEGLADNGRSTALQAAFARRNALQCGFCTPGMLASALAYIDRGGAADRQAIRDHLSGNYCRCTGYQSIVDAICDVIDGHAKGGQEGGRAKGGQEDGHAKDGRLGSHASGEQADSCASDRQSDENANGVHLDGARA